MTFAAPAALWTLALLAPLAALYILHFRRRPVEVSSLMLWSGLKAPSDTGRKIHKLQTPLSLLLEALAFIALVALAAGPIARTTQRTPLAIILDNSMSMSATHQGRSALDRGLEAVESTLAETQPSNTTLILAGPTPEIIATRESPKTTPETAKNAWQGTRGTADMTAAITLARTVADRNTQILVITDHPPADIEQIAPLKWIALGNPAPNTAIVSAVRTPTDPSTDAIIIDIANWSNQPRDVPITVQTEAQDWDPSTNALAPLQQTTQRTVRIAPAAQSAIRLETTATTRAVTVTLGPDALEQDNTATLVPVRSPPVRVRIDASSDQIASTLRRAANATGRATIVETQAELVLTDQHTGPTNQPTTADQWRLAFRTPAPSPLSIEGPTQSLITSLGPFTINRAHPLAEGLELAGVRWTHEPIWTPSTGSPWIYVGQHPVAFTTDNGQSTVINADLQTGNFAQSAALPVIVWNTLAARAAARPGPAQRNVTAESIITVGLAGIPGEHIDPQGTNTTLPPIAATVDVPVQAPGIHVFQAAGTTTRAAVNPTFQTEGNLQSTASEIFGEWPAPSNNETAGRSIGALFGVLAVLLAAAHAALLWTNTKANAPATPGSTI